MSRKTVDVFIKLRKYMENFNEQNAYVNKNMNLEEFYKVMSDFINSARNKIAKSALGMVEVEISYKAGSSNFFKIETIDSQALLFKVLIPQSVARYFVQDVRDVQKKKMDIIGFYSQIGQVLLSETVNVINSINLEWNRISKSIEGITRSFILGLSTIAVVQQLSSIINYVIGVTIKDRSIEIKYDNGLSNEINSSVLSEFTKKCDISGEYMSSVDLTELMVLIFEVYFKDVFNRYSVEFEDFILNSSTIQVDVNYLIDKEISRSKDLNYIATLDLKKYPEYLNLLLKASHILKAIRSIPTSLKILGKSGVLSYENELPDGRYGLEDYDIVSRRMRNTPRIGFSLYHPKEKDLTFRLELVNISLDIQEIIRQVKSFNTEIRTITKKLQDLLNQPFPQKGDPIQLKHDILQLQKNILEKWTDFKRKLVPTE